MKVKVTVQCQDCGGEAVFHKKIIELEETPFWLDCVEYDEDKDYEEYCSVYKEDKIRRKNE